MKWLWDLVLVLSMSLIYNGINAMDTAGESTCKGIQLPVDCKCKSVHGPKSRSHYDCHCSNKEWTNVHKEFPEQLEKLFLANNLLTALNSNSFRGCSKMTSLDLSNNTLTSIGEGTFDEMTHLQKLYLQNNKLRFSDPKSVPKSMLKHNKDLLVLFLEHNNWYEETEYNSDLFYSLTKLKALHMDGIEGAEFDENFKNLKTLEKIALTGGIKSITNHTFKYFSRLQHLHELAFSGGQLNYVDKLGFSHFPHLKTLRLNGNWGLTFAGFQISTYGLSAQLRVLLLSNITTHNTEITQEFFYRLRNLIHLETLVLSFDNIIRVDFKNICKNIPNLKLINFEVNKINQIDNLSDLSDCKKCSQISMQSQSKQDTHEFCDQVYITLPPNLTNIKLLNAFACSEIRRVYIDIKGGHKFKHVDLTHNGITSIQGPIKFIEPCDPSINSEIVVNLNSNSIANIDQIGIDKSISRCIKTLSLSNNKLGYLIRKLRGVFFEYYDNLENLLLATNGISTIQSDLFTRLQSLKKLYLPDNEIKSLFNMASVPLESLILDRNDIEYITMTDCEALDEVDTNGKLTVSLDNNPFVCSCKSYPFLNWIITTSVGVTRWENNKCGDEPINRETLTNKILPFLSFKCHVKIWFIIGGITTTGIVATSLLVIFLYRKRWCLKYWCIKTMRNRKRHQLLREHDTRDLYQYDAFVMYAGDDSAWVANNLVPNLESQKYTEGDSAEKLKLCIHQRDFLGGVDISENIVQAIDSSFKCLVILSRKFCQSEWAQFEIQMARSRSNAEGRNVIIVIRLEEVPLCEMSTSLIYILQNHTYIDYPENEEAMPTFWEKVTSAIKDSC